MTGLEIITDLRDIVTAGAAIVAGIQSWRAHTKSKKIDKVESDLAAIQQDVKAILAQQQAQAQKQTQNITVNVGTGAAGAVTETINLSDAEEGQ